MYCNNCGTPNPDGSAFCSKCGNRLNPPQATAQQTQGAVAPARKTNGLAIAALVLGIASFLPPLAICSIPAIIIGAIALNQIKKEPALEGKGMAMAGLICGSIAVFLWICLIILGIAIFFTDSSTTSNFSVSALTISSLI
jgi:uncharacterized membrane protein YvbJ